MRNQRTLLFSGLVVLGVVATIWLWPHWYCEAAYKDYGFRVAVCPSGELRQIASVSANGLLRGGDGEVSVSVKALYTTDKSDEVEHRPLTNFEVKLYIVDHTGSETTLAIQKQNKQKKPKWRNEDGLKTASVKLPLLNDGDYLLRAKVDSKVGQSVVDVKLALYAPARIHVLTDRPLYEPGNLVQFRALALRARDLTPIDNRPGTWLVRSPSGEVLLEEHSPTVEWGVIDGDFPLTDDAEEGTWTVAWKSGNNEEHTSFRVEPFVLPRFRVEAAAEQSYYQAGQAPSVAGSVIYGSGAPVADAKLEIRWSASGAWPPPSEWLEGEALPREASAGADGRFVLKLPIVPADLRGRATLRASISAIDPAGDRVSGAVSLLLSEDKIQVSAVTELRGGLVENNNNRVYLRVTSPEGFALGGAKINVKRAWAPNDTGIEAELDTDGVARIQFDPGRPVSIVVPPMPVRKSLASASAGAASLYRLTDLVSQGDGVLADQIAIEKWLPALQPCGRWVGGAEEQAQVSFRVSPAGALTSITPGDAPLDVCVAAGLRGKRLPPGTDRLYAAVFSVPDSGLATLDAEVESSGDDASGLEEILQKAALESRRCLPQDYDGKLPWVLYFETQARSKKITYSWLKETSAEERMPAGADGCILSSLRGQDLQQEAHRSVLGVVRYHIDQPGQAEKEYAPQPTILQGYELTVSAVLGDNDFGSTKLQMQPGSVPDLRLRATPVMAKAGQTIELAFYRGPQYQGDLPEEIQFSHNGDLDRIKLKKKAKGASYALPKDAKGWYRFHAQGAQALVFVRSDEDLSVTVLPGAEVYRPGEMAELNVQTSIAGDGAKAAVGLFGVDKSLSQITTLRGPDDLGSVRKPIVMQEKAFGSLDAAALTMGRIQGAHAAEATILRVESIPAPEQVDVLIYTSAETEFSPISEMTDSFYLALAELHVQTRAWERSAPKGQTMSPLQMKKLWDQALKACKARGEPALDAYGRPLKLRWLPSDLLELTSPAAVVADTTRLAEDVENWQQWVAKERP